MASLTFPQHYRQSSAVSIDLVHPAVKNVDFPLSAGVSALQLLKGSHACRTSAVGCYWRIFALVQVACCIIQSRAIYVPEKFTPCSLLCVIQPVELLCARGPSRLAMNVTRFSSSYLLVWIRPATTDATRIILHISESFFFFFFLGEEKNEFPQKKTSLKVTFFTSRNKTWHTIL